MKKEGKKKEKSMQTRKRTKKEEEKGGRELEKWKTRHDSNQGSKNW